jgi:NosR/NirI family nitrous oxide reductase transcriptional regulator
MRDRISAGLTAAAVFLLLLPLFAPAALFAAPAVDRVPRPEFQSGYQELEMQTPPPRSAALGYLDVVVLGLALVVSGWLAIRARSREGIFLLGAFSIAYFGFFRRGCICPIGSIQNVALALADPGYAIPAVAVAFFALPLLSALLTGRTFCAGVCPFGALQDAVIVRPLRLPRWLAAGLGVLPAVYLGLAVLYAATGADFIVCRFDPFVNFFRMGGSAEILGLGALFLALGTVVARPYCRFLCPYGLVLGWLSRLSLKHATITPDSCVHCRLCEEACPVDAIRPGSPPGSPPAAGPMPRAEKRAFAMALVALPLLVGLGAAAGFQLSPVLARLHPTVRLAAQVLAEDAGRASGTTLESEAFRSTRTTTEQLVAQSEVVLGRFRTAGPVLGVFVMLVVGLSVLGSFSRRRMSDHHMDQAACVSCGRCFSYCPREHLRLKGSRP